MAVTFTNCNQCFSLPKERLQSCQQFLPSQQVEKGAVASSGTSASQTWPIFYAQHQFFSQPASPVMLLDTATLQVMNLQHVPGPSLHQTEKFMQAQETQHGLRLTGCQYLSALMWAK